MVLLLDVVPMDRCPRGFEPHFWYQMSQFSTVYTHKAHPPQNLRRFFPGTRTGYHSGDGRHWVRPHWLAAGSQLGRSRLMTSPDRVLATTWCNAAWSLSADHGRGIFVKSSYFQRVAAPWVYTRKWTQIRHHKRFLEWRTGESSPGIAVEFGRHPPRTPSWFARIPQVPSQCQEVPDSSGRRTQQSSLQLDRAGRPVRWHGPAANPGESQRILLQLHHIFSTNPGESFTRSETILILPWFTKRSKAQQGFFIHCFPLGDNTRNIWIGQRRSPQSADHRWDGRIQNIFRSVCPFSLTIINAHKYQNSRYRITGARLDARTYTFAHPIWRTTNAARKQGAISPILPMFCRYYLCNAIMLIKLSMVWPWVTGITALEVAIVVVNFARDARMNTVNVCRMRERIKQDARTSLLMRERTHIVHWGSFYQHGLIAIPA